MNFFRDIVKLLLITLALFITYSSNIYAQSTEGYVAKIGDKYIFADDFKVRYEFTPHVGRHIGSAKKEFLVTLIAEKIWAEKARSLGLDKKTIIASTINAIKKMFVRDKLYRMEILANVNITDRELADAVDKELSKLQIQYLRSSNKESIDNMHYLISTGYPFDSLLVNRPEINDPKNNAFLAYSEMNQFIVDSVYNLHVGEFTKPIQVGSEWFVFKLKGKETQFFPNAEGKNSIIKNARDKLKDDKSAVLYKDFMQKMFVDKEIKVDANLFRFIAEKFSEVLKVKPNIYDTLFIDSNDAYYIVNTISQDTLDLPFIVLDDKSVNVGDFILEQSFYGFETSSFELPVIERDLNIKTRQFIENEVLAREGLKRGFAELPEVQSDIEMWEDYYLSYFYKNSIKDSISINSDEVKEFVNEERNKTRSFFEYKVIELLTDDLNLIGDALSISDENELREFVSIHTKREQSKSNNGELGWFSYKDFPELTTIADELQTGEVYGPLKLTDGYSLIKLIGKRQVNESVLGENGIDTLLAKQYLKEKKFSDALIKNTIHFANELGIEINEDALMELPTTNINSYLIRVFGFGGTLPAVPLSTPFTYWYEFFMNQEKISL